MYNKEFGKYLAERRIKANFDSQRQLALAAGISSPTISRIESGAQQAEPETLKKLAPCLNVSYEELLAEAGYVEDDATKQDNPEMQKLYRVIARANELDKEDIEAVSRVLETLIDNYKRGR